MNGKANGLRTKEPRITRIELTPVFVPFREYVKEAMRSAGGLGMAIAAEEAWLGGDFVVCRLTAEDGSVGLGEAFVWLPETGVSPEQILGTVNDALGKYVLTESPFHVEKIRYRMDINVARNDVAKGLLDMACYDLMGRIAGRPAGDFMGGRVVDEIPLAALIPLMSPEEMVELARGFHNDGVRTFRLKLGKSLPQDVLTLKRMREAFGDDVRIRVDYNQAYRKADLAIPAIRALEPYGIDYAEQPVRTTDYIGMAMVQRSVGVPILSHEDCFSLQDIVTLIELKAVGIVGINGVRPGGVTNALRAITYAEMRGIGAVIHSQPCGIESAMLIHLAAARHHALGHATELFGHIMMEHDLLAEPIDYSGGTATVPPGPGWGVELDEAALAKYATGPTVTIRA